MLFQKLHLCLLIENKTTLRTSRKKEENQQNEGNLMKMFLKSPGNIILAKIYKQWIPLSTFCL